MKYRLKPVDALQWPGHYTPEFKTFLGDNLKETEPREGIGVVGYFALTQGGKQWLHKGDYVARDINGELFHFSQYDFEKRYEKVD